MAFNRISFMVMDKHAQDEMLFHLDQINSADPDRKRLGGRQLYDYLLENSALINYRLHHAKNGPPFLYYLTYTDSGCAFLCEYERLFQFCLHIAWNDITSDGDSALAHLIDYCLRHKIDFIHRDYLPARDIWPSAFNQQNQKGDRLTPAARMLQSDYGRMLLHCYQWLTDRVRQNSIEIADCSQGHDHFIKALNTNGLFLAVRQQEQHAEIKLYKKPKPGLR